jgi:hypothetical protein
MQVGRRGGALLLAIGAAILAATVPAPAVAASPSASVNLGAGGFGMFAVDQVSGNVFVSLPQANEVAELTPQGQLRTTIPDVYGAFGMTIVGRDLYVAESTNGTIARIDLGSSTLAAQTISAGIDAPYWIAFAGGKLWAGTEPAEGASQLIRIDPGTGAWSAYGGSYYGSFLVSSPADQNALYMAEDQVEPEPLHRFDVSSGAPRDTVANPSRDWAGAWHNMVLSPDGSRLIGAVGSPYEFDELCSQTLQPDGLRYPGQAYPQAVGVSQSGALATALTGYDNPDLAVFKLGVPSAYFTAESSYAVESGGVALSPDGRELYVAEADNASPAKTIVETYGVPAAPAQAGTNPCPVPTGGSSSWQRGGSSGSGTGTSGSAPQSTATGQAGVKATVTRKPGEIRAVYRVTPRKRSRRPAARFTLTLVLRAVRGGYRYAITLSGLHCRAGANELLLALAGRRRAVSCARNGTHMTGRVAPASRYAIRAQAAVIRARRKPRLGAAYVLIAPRPPARA